MRSDQFTERILRFMGQQGYRPQKLRALARSMGIADEEYGEFRDNVKALMHAGRIVLGSSRVLTLPESSTGRIVGTFRLNPRGFGFVVPDSPDAHGDLYVPAGKNRGAITGDRVSAKVARRGKREGKMLFEGSIVDIISRGRNQFVGELCQEIGRWFVRPDGNTLHAPIFIDDPGAKSAREGDQVVVEVTQYPDVGQDAHGVVVRRLGKRGEPDVDTLSMVIQYQLPEAFEEEVLEAARQASQSYDPRRAAEGRTDLRNVTTITIDPDDARDFDDAISLTHNKDGTMELGVHIADVSHFVLAGGVLDQEAYERANSVYFPRYVIPMLPEVLSNGVCSLQERQPRLTKSAFITYDRQGNVVSSRFANTIIQSAKRLTYRQATGILEGKAGRTAKKVVSLVKDMERLARVIRDRRIKSGMVVLDLPEVDLVFDDEDRVIGTTPADTSFSHTIIEMFMVEANEAVARLFAGRGVPHLRRIHPEPEEAAGEALAKFLGVLGLKPPKMLDRFALQAILARAAGKPASFAVNLAVLRSMQPAEYSPRLIGHYALASEHYVHFTSPIRRYPDLTVHRLLDAFFRGELDTKRGRASVPNQPELEKIGEHCSQNERRAEDAERELRLVKILQLLEDRVGETFEGVVTGVTNFGLYVQLREHLVDGLLRFADLGDDWWEVDVDRGCVSAERSGQRIMLGQPIEVTIARVNIAARQIDLTMAPTGERRSRGEVKVKTGRNGKAGKRTGKRIAKKGGRRQGGRRGRR